MALGSLLTISLYISLCTQGLAKFGEHDRMQNYNMLAQALLRGRLSIADVSPDCLNADVDQRDPIACRPPVIDLLVYNGKYYQQQNPLPVLFHVLPIVLLGKELPTGAAIMLFSCGSVIVFAFIISKVRTFFFVTSPTWLIYVGISFFAFSGMQLYMVSRQVVYHEAIAAGAFFMLLGTLFFFQGVTVSSNHKVYFGYAGLFLGAAVASKISFVWYPVCFWLLYAGFQIRSKLSFHQLAEKTFFFAVPLAFLFSLLLILNYLRFGDPTDFGQTHMVFHHKALYEYCVLDGNLFSVSHVPYNLSTYFTEFPELAWRYGLPYLRFLEKTVISNENIIVFNEQAVCLFVMAPALLLCFSMPYILRTCSRSKLFYLVITVCLIPSAVTFLFYTTEFWATPRYLYEFTPLVYVVIYIILACFWKRYRAHSLRRTLFIAAISVMSIANAIMGLYLGINGMVSG